MTIDLNTAGDQRSFDVIPAGTILTLQMIIRPGGVGDGGWLKNAADDASTGLDCEFIVVGGDYDKRKIWQRFTIDGTTPGHAEAGKISLNTLRAMVESARGICPDDKSEAAQAVRRVDWADLNGLRFMAKIGVRPPKEGYAAKNIIREVITPDRQVWKKPEQITQPTNSGPSQVPTTPPANAIARPQWAG
jgi:hypothetical protein